MAISSKAKLKENIQKLITERNRILAEIEALKNKAGGLELAISLLQTDHGIEEVSGTEKVSRGSIKVLLLDLLKEVGSLGMNATSAVEIAARRGVKLNRGSAAANLSRLKRDKIVVHDGDKYRLPEFSRQPALAVVAGKSS